MSEERSQLLKIEQIAELFQVPRETVVRWIDRGLLKALRVEEEYRVAPKEVDRFIGEREQATRRAVQAARQRALQEERTYCHLYQWMSNENRQLTSLYRGLDDTISAMVEAFRQELDHCQDRLRAKGFREALDLLYSKWERPSRAYRQWILNHERRWQSFQQELGVSLGPSVIPPSEALVDPEKASVAIFDRVISAPSPLEREEPRIYEKLYHWVKGEHENLTEHHRALESAIEGMIDTLKKQARKASKKLEIEQSIAYNDAASIVQRHWEGVRRSYNHWILERTERWNLCRQNIQRDLAALEGTAGEFLEETGEE